MRFCLGIGPIKDNVCSRNTLDLMGVRIDWVLTGVQRFNPNAFLAFSHQISVLEGTAGQVLALIPYVGHHYTHMGDRDVSHINQLYRSKQRVDEVTAGHEYLFLSTFRTATIDESLRILEGIVARNFFAGDLTRPQGGALFGGYDTDLIL